MGRKRKPGERSPCGKLKRPLPLGPTPQHLAHRLAAGGNADMAHDYPLSILLARGRIDLKQHDAGMRLLAVYRRVIGNPFAVTRILGEVGGRTGFNPVAALYDERWLRQAFLVLDRAGGGMRAAVLAAAVHLSMPSLADGALLGRLRIGLQLLADLDRPRVSEAERHRAVGELTECG
jgi:hypothetical protein